MLKWQQCWEDGWTFRNTNNFTCHIRKSKNRLPSLNFGLAYKGESKCDGVGEGKGEGVGGFKGEREWE